MFRAALLAFGCLILLGAAETEFVVSRPMQPPEWALLERELLRANSEACDRFAAKYLDSLRLSPAYAALGHTERRSR
jgi:hypothetical protein